MGHRELGRISRYLVASVTPYHAQAIKTVYPNTVAFVTWNNRGPVGNDYIDTSPASVAQYQMWARDPYYGITLDPSAGAGSS